MSGSGGGGGGGGGYTPRDEGVPCESLEFDASISSPQRETVAGLSVGEVLEVTYREDEGTRSIVLVTAAGAEVGALLTRTAELLRCMQAGVGYEAVVRRIQNGAVTVHVQPA
jgi:hypothetical protein